MNSSQIEQNVNGLIDRFDNKECSQADFIYELLLAYGHNKGGVKRLSSGERNIAKDPSEVIFKRHLYFKKIESDNLLSEIDRMRNEKLVSANRIRFVIVTNYKQLLAVDTKTADTLDIALTDLPRKFDFFLPWANIEKAVYQGENPADVKAAEKMAKLFDLIKNDNEKKDDSSETRHHLNVFLTRILFCYFAEDTGIFKTNQFSESIESHTNIDGSDLADYLNRLFKIMDTQTEAPTRDSLPDYLAEFRYVNGGLFADEITSPQFSTRSRRLLIECGTELDWSEINPDIFGSMFQAVLRDSSDSDNTEHYTSVSNILKVIQPLFLDDFYSELDKITYSGFDLTRKINNLKRLQNRLSEINFFDPACGSGNFLIIAYKEVRKFEIELLERQQYFHSQNTGGQNLKPFSVISLNQFYGIELDDFAHEIAGLSLWLAEHQMNQEFELQFGSSPPSLPLTSGGNICCGNATRLDWEEICPAGGEVFIMGNPPFKGARKQSPEHKADMDHVFSAFRNYRDLDYVSCWFYLGANYIRGNDAKLALVSTNSICQGLQVGLLWPNILLDDIHIYFAYQSFKWSNSAKANAGVTVIIVGLENSNRSSSKTLFDSVLVREVKHINPYLLESVTVFVHRRSTPLSDMKEMSFGNMPNDGGALILSESERNELISTEPDSEPFVKSFVGAVEFIRGYKRYCLWITDERKEDACAIKAIAERIGLSKKHRLDSKDKGTNKLALRPHQFRDTNIAKKSQIIVPRVSSENRDYLTVGILHNDAVVSDSAQVIYDGEPWHLSILSSKLHMLWLKAVGGKLETRYRYSKDIVYNNFPLPDLSDVQKEKLVFLSLNIFEQRERNSDKTIAQLYDPKKMPEELLEAHKENDSYVESLYRSKPFDTDAERLEALFKLFSDMTGTSNA